MKQNIIQQKNAFIKTIIQLNYKSIINSYIKDIK